VLATANRLGHFKGMAGRFFLIAILLLAAAPARADLITRLPTDERVVALTFDACEAGEKVAFDRAVLDFLVQRKIPFTVFASGRFVETNFADVQALAALDFVDIENHSWNHPNTMNHFRAEAVLDQVGRAHNAIVTATGRQPQFFRFPAGNFNEAGLKAVESLGYRVVDWRWASGDPDRHQSADALVKRTAANVQSGDVLIFHINGRGVHTAEALPRIVAQLEADGYRFVLLSDYIGTRHPRAAPEFSIVSARQRLDDLVKRAPLAALFSVMR
jgi:peptidoglycan/xylan/chitin deacetylase (PgdA/CDA1 family)